MHRIVGCTKTKSSRWCRKSKIRDKRNSGFSSEQISSKNPVEETEWYLEPNPSEEEEREQVRLAEIIWAKKITHTWFPERSLAQNVVRYAYELWGYDFVAVFECENGSYNMNSKWDNWHAHGLCQINDRYHKDIPAEYRTDYKVAVEYCYKKWKAGVPFYWPTRLIKGQKCYNYVKNRFIFE